MICIYFVFYTPTNTQNKIQLTNHCSPNSLLASYQDNQAGILTTTVYGGPHGAQSSLLGPYAGHYPGGYGGHYMDNYRNQYPGQYSSGGSEGQVPPPLPRPAPAPLAPRDRSSSAPNVCINLVNPSSQSDAGASLAEFAQRIGKNYNPTSPGRLTHFCNMAGAISGFFIFIIDLDMRIGSCIYTGKYFDYLNLLFHSLM